MNKINLEKIFNKQIKLDEKIMKNRKHDQKQIFSNRVLALLVELAEFANEGKEFKYWSLNKSNVNRMAMLEEYIDCLHFLSTIGIEMKVTPIIEFQKKKHSNKLEILRKLFYLISTLFEKHNVTKKVVQEIFTSFMELGNASGFNEKEIFDMYNYKNKINYDRLKEGY